MAIRKTDGSDLTENDIGKYVLRGPDSRESICGNAYKLEQIIKNTCHVSRVRRRLNREIAEIEQEKIQTRSIRYVADTELEAEWLRAMSEDKEFELRKLHKEIDKRYENAVLG